MICQFERIIYPPGEAEQGCYMVALYQPCGKIRDTAGNRVTQIKAVGYCLPTAKNLRYDIKGHWSKSPKHGLQFEVEGYDEVIAHSKEGIIAYLSSGQIKGIGPKIAERIFDRFGLNTLDVLDREPERLLAVSGISEGKLQKICDSYLAGRGARDVVAFLAPHGISLRLAVRLYKEYGNQTMDMIRNHPYQLCEMAGIGFGLADRIAMSAGLHRLSPERVDAGILYTLADAEGKGHLCLEKREFLRMCIEILDTPQLTVQMVADRAARLINSGRLATYRDSVYREKTAKAEESLADAICYQMKCRRNDSYGNLDQELDQEEAGLRVKLALEQRTAVKSALTEGLCIITGGPGTGKTMIQKFILDIYRRNYPQNEICCCAPTGRAARRMEQSTGFAASTVHKALGLTAQENGKESEPEMLGADLVLVDEVSMLDVFLAGHLFRSLKAGSHVVLIGDADQLPSVGPGAVLSEMIASRVIPVVRLDKVYRQNAGSQIAINARQIRHGGSSLEYGDDFRLVPSTDLAVSAKKLMKLYLQETAVYGVDQVALLTPYRQKTETGVNALNGQLRELVNPASPEKAELACGKKRFRCGDKVMQVKNHGDINNGDSGYVTNVLRQGDEPRLRVDFGDGRVKDYDSSELDMLDLAYASTIHKSQGAEYQSVIISLQSAHYVMLTRPLLYTAITRGKERVIIVGEKKALHMAVRRTDTKKRQTYLAQRIRELAE